MYCFNDDLYFTKKNTEKLHQHKYSCIDHSLLNTYIFNKYLYQPILTYLIPRNLAPNIISILGLIACLLALVVHYLNIFGRYEYLIIGILLFLYQLFDSLDGMQARRTKSSSALGELVDHGIDAFTSGIIIVILTQQCGMNQTQQIILILECYIVFYMNHFIGYFEGKLEFGYILNPTEALCILIIYQIIRTIFNLTPYIFQTTKLGNLSLNTLLVIILTIFALVNVITILIKLRNYSNIIKTIYPFIIIIIIALFIMMKKTNSSILLQLKIFTSILLLTHYIQLFIAHYILQIDRPGIGFLYSTFILFSNIYLVNISNINLITGNLTGIDSFPTVILIIFGFSFAFLSELSLIINVFIIFSKVLRLHPFTI
ncbi:choline/ethanolaminephosphotransferase, putative [Entamoeba dispar SAW760]|uniref:Choline/ethanolaminephosphotransferase, putative n=1 Tax=Entamoeba dispar (strain ATCC PRA-260 / SAW760) TaxID=370354 RepID=B0EMF7_ENTDS|nr:choline/ethanolaminephosphotransferase, putative [Entamoeba dispar SAW760]EDR24280.1 choline/ethanolaminephosphotransferase, putative [Entamoeba dispar SAW760]|eukprot:EDR24280.1 choline/ethanolaminephosphotransferase, putative [Entamoeba dispar SAW760]